MATGLFGTGARVGSINQTAIQPAGIPGSTFVRPQQREAGGKRARATVLFDRDGKPLRVMDWKDWCQFRKDYGPQIAADGLSLRTVWTLVEVKSPRTDTSQQSDKDARERIQKQCAHYGDVPSRCLITERDWSETVTPSRCSLCPEVRPSG